MACYPGMSVSNWTKVRTPWPVGPFARKGFSSFDHRVPAISRCTQGVSPANSPTNMAPVMAAPYFPADIRQVRDRTLVKVTVIFVHRKRPHFLPRRGCRCQHSLHPFFVPAKNPRGDIPQSDGDGAGKGGRINQHRAAELLRVGERVGKDQASFCIRIEDFDGLAGH